MLIETIKNRLEKELVKFTQRLDTEHALSKTSPLLFHSIEEFVRRPGKRIRPVLFLLGYLGFAERPVRNIYRCALSIELLHDFALVHDDIIDKSVFRRGRLSMPAAFDEHLKKFRRTKFQGADLALVAGDIMYALALYAFLAVDERLDRKEKALKQLIRSAIATGSGEFMEILCDASGLARTEKSDIYRIYELKTANYTFATPLAAGAILAGAGRKDVARLFRVGINTGIAFQIKDDLCDLLDPGGAGDREALADLRETKSTLPVWYAYRSSSPAGKRALESIFSRKKAGAGDWDRLKRMIESSGGRGYAQAELESFLRKAEKVTAGVGLKPEYREALIAFSRAVLFA